MPSRPIWKGFVQFSLVSIPVQAHTATVAEGDGVRAALNQLHRDCGIRIRYRKTCPVHGEVRNDEIVSGYEFSPGRYVEVRPEELDAIRSPKEKAFDIEASV